jgi:hypothetical protein
MFIYRANCLQVHRCFTVTALSYAKQGVLLWAALLALLTYKLYTLPVHVSTHQHYLWLQVYFLAHAYMPMCMQLNVDM